LTIITNIELDKINYNKLLALSKFHNLSTNEFIKNLLEKELENIVYFEHGFTYDRMKI